MHKDHNMMVPIMEGINTINSYGMEVVSGIIMGLDTDKPETGDALLDFVDESRIPLLTINLLQALPKTPLWDRLEREGRLSTRTKAAIPMSTSCCPTSRSSVPGANAWSSPMSRRKLFARYQYQCEYTYANRLKVPVAPGEARAGPTSGAA